MLNQPTTIQISGIAATLSRCSLFAALTVDELMRVAALAEIVTFKKGDVITHAGGLLPGIYVVQSGRVMFVMPGPNKNQTLERVLKPGMCIGLMSMTPSYRSMSGSVAFGPVKLIHLPREPLMQLYKAIPELPLYVTEALCDYVRFTVSRAQRQKAHSIEARLASWLLEQPVEMLPDALFESGSGAGEIGVVTLDMAKAALARELGVTQPPLSRAFSRFRKEGLILSKGTTVYILKRAELEIWAAEKRMAGSGKTGTRRVSQRVHA